MKGIYKAVEVSSPGRLRVVERSVPEPERVKFGFAWKHAESVTPIRHGHWHLSGSHSAARSWA